MLVIKQLIVPLTFVVFRSISFPVIEVNGDQQLTPMSQLFLVNQKLYSPTNIARYPERLTLSLFFYTNQKHTVKQVLHDSKKNYSYEMVLFTFTSS